MVCDMNGQFTKVKANANIVNRYVKRCSNSLVMKRNEKESNNKTPCSTQQIGKISMWSNTECWRGYG